MAHIIKDSEKKIWEKLPASGLNTDHQWIIVYSWVSTCCSVSLPADMRPPEIEFQNVSFHYTEEKPVLEEINFVIAPGTVTAVVGATGCGKSTLAKLLFRFPYSYNILFLSCPQTKVLIFYIIINKLHFSFGCFLHNGAFGGWLF